MAISKIVYKENANATPEVWMDTTDKTADSGNMLNGITALKNDGTTATGNIASKTSSDLIVSGATVTAPAGYYASSASQSVSSGSATTPATTITANPSISVGSDGLITATASATKSVTPTVSAGYVSSGTAGTITVSGSNTSQLSTQAAQTIYPSTSDQTIASGKYLAGAQTVKGVLLTNLSAGNIKKDVVVKVGDSADDDRITSVTGTYEGSGGGITPAAEKDVNFIDYDGTIVYSYTKAEFASLSALPANPSHTGLTAQGWNWGLSDAKTYVASYGKLWIGQMYVTTSNKTEIDIELGNPDLLHPYLKLSVNGTVTVDWGDGSATDTVTGTSLTTSKYANHTYAATGKYTISVGVTSGSFAFYNTYILTYQNSYGNSSRQYNTAVVALRSGKDIAFGDYACAYCHALRYITLPSSVTAIGTSCFQDCSSLRSITIPSGVATIGSYSISYCYALQNVSLPKSVTTTSNNSIRNNYSLQNISTPSGITAIGGNQHFNCYSLQDMVIPSEVTSIGASAFSGCYSLYSVTFKPTSVPTVSNVNAWSSVPSSCAFYVPFSALADYLTASNYPSTASYQQYTGYATYTSGATLPTQDSTQAYNVTWYASKADARAQTNAISQGNGSEIYCRYTEV